MSRSRAEIIHAVPQLAPLSNTELTDYLAAFRAAHARKNRVSGCTLAISGAVFVAIAAFVLFILVISVFRSMLAISPALAAVFLAVSLIGVPWFMLRFLLRERARARLANFDQALLARLMQSPPMCVRCGYGLAGVGPADHRGGVVRCPECAMVCPVDDPAHPPVNSAPPPADEQTSREPAVPDPARPEPAP